MRVLTAFLGSLAVLLAVDKVLALAMSTDSTLRWNPGGLVRGCEGLQKSSRQGQT